MSTEVLNNPDVSLRNCLSTKCKVSPILNLDGTSVYEDQIVLEKQVLSENISGYIDYTLNRFNTVTADAPPPPQKDDIYNQNIGISCLLDSTHSSGKDYGKRDFRNSSLKRSFPGISWSNNPWDFMAVYQELAINEFNIVNSNYNLFRNQDFLDCYSRKGATGKIYIEKGNSEKRYRERFHCGEPGCLLCGKKSRKRLSLEWIEDYKQIIEKNPGCPGFSSFVFTTQKEYEGVPLKDQKKEKIIIDGIQKTLRKAFGLKSKSNLIMNISIHPIGDSDLFRDRWHVHVVVLPAEITKDKKTGKHIFKWVSPVHVADNHTEKDWKLDLSWLRDEYNKILLDAFGVTSFTQKAIPPQVEFIPYNKNAKYWKGQLKGRKFEGVFWSKVTHKFEYDMRSFARDLENSVVLTDKVNKNFILKSEGTKEEDISCWLFADGETLVQRYKWIKKHNKVRARGWGQCKKKYTDLLGLKEDDPGEKPDCIVCNAKIEMINRRVFNPKIGKVVWEREEIYHFKCPISKRDISINAKNLAYWKWDSQFE